MRKRRFARSIVRRPRARKHRREIGSVSNGTEPAGATRSTGIASMPPDVKPPDQSVFDPKDVPDHFIGEEIPSEIAHRLMHFDDHFRLWAFRKRNRLDVRIDHDVEK